MAKRKDQEPKQPVVEQQDQFDPNLEAPDVTEDIEVGMNELEKEEAAKPQPTPTAPKTAVTKFQKFQKGTQLVEHHLFKLLVSTMKKNISWVYRSPTVQEIEHVHFFHSINDTTLQKNRFSTPVGGHFHEVIITYDKDGEIVDAKCGPAVHYATKRVGGGQTVRRLERIKWEKYDDRPMEQVEENTFEIDQNTPIQNAMPVLVEADMHTHELMYLGTEEFSAHTKAEKRKEETQKVKGLMAGQPVSTQPGAMQGLTNQPDSDKMQKILKEGGERQASS